MSVVLSFLLSVPYQIIYMNHLKIILCQFLAATISVAALETKISIFFNFFAVSVVISLQFSVAYQIGYFNDLKIMQSQFLAATTILCQLYKPKLVSFSSFL